MAVRADLFGDLVGLLKEELIEAEYKLPPDGDVPLLYFNVLRRTIHPAPRRVHEAPGLVCPSELTGLFRTLKLKMERGESLLPHQSRKLAKKRSAKANDGMLSRWDIQHLHFDPAGGSEVLYGRFTDTDAYLLAILPHGHWTDRTLIELLCQTWPESVEDRRLNIKPSKRLTDEEFERLCDLNGNVTIEVEGRVYAVGGGTMASGVDRDVVVVADSWWYRTKDFERSILHEIEQRRATAEASSDFFPEEISVKLTGKADWILVAESPELKLRWLAGLIGAFGEV